MVVVSEKMIDSVGKRGIFFFWKFSNVIVSVKVFGLDLFDAPGVKIITDFRMKVFVKLYVMTILEWK